MYSAPIRLNYTQPYCELVPFMTYPVINEQTVINLLKQQMCVDKYVVSLQFLYNLTYLLFIFFPDLTIFQQIIFVKTRSLGFTWMNMVMFL